MHDACENVGVSDDLSQFSVAHLLERFASHHAPHVEPGTPGDSGGGIPVVAGDRDNSNACRSAFLHRVGHARTQRIGQTDEPKKFEGKLARRSRVFAGAEGPTRYAKDPKPLDGHVVDRILERRAFVASKAT